QLGRGKWLQQHFDVRRAIEDLFYLRIAGDQQRRNVGTQQARLAQEVSARQVRHGVIGNDQIEVAVALLEQGKRLCSIIGLPHLMTTIFEQRGGRASDLLVIVDQQHLE